MAKQKKLPNGDMTSVGATYKGELKKPDAFSKKDSGKFTVKSIKNNEITLEHVKSGDEYTISVEDMNTHVKRNFLDRVN